MPGLRRAPDALELGRTALELARERAERANEAHALRRRGAIAAARVPRWMRRRARRG